MKKIFYILLLMVLVSSCYVAARHLKWSSPHVDVYVDTLTSILGK